jgi:hypothetical protein
VLPAETATALIPGICAIPQEHAPPVEAHLTSSKQPAVQAYELDYHNESHGFFFALGNGNDKDNVDNEAWSFGPWSSDARVLYCRVQNHKLAQLVVIGGTYLAWQGQPLLTMKGSSEFWEWRRQDALLNSAAGESSVTPLLEELADGSRFSSANHISSNQASLPYVEKH